MKFDHDPDVYREILLRRLDSLADFMAPLEIVSGVFDDDWRSEVQGEIERADLTRCFESESVPFFMLFGEDDRSLLFQNFRGFLPVLERRLASLATVPEAEAKFRAKLQELRACRSMAKQFDFLFELSVLGVVAIHGHLLEIEPIVGSGTVDGLARLDERHVLVEATHCTKKMFPAGPDIFSIDPELLADQVRYKVAKKAAGDKQLALAGDRPTILEIALGFDGAMQLEAKWAIDECFAMAEFDTLSAVVVSDSWKLLRGQLHVNPKARVPLTENELCALDACLQISA